MIRLKECREQNHMSQKFVALSVGVSAPTVSMWESGKKEPTRENLLKLADLFHVTVDYLLDRPEASPAAGDLLSLNREELLILQIFRQLNPAGRQYLLKNAQFALEDRAYRQDAASPLAM